MKLLALLTVALLQMSTLPTMDQIRTTYQNKQYPEVVKMVAQVMPTAIKGGGSYDHAELLEIKGESALQLKQFPVASDAFKQAAALAKDEKSGALDRAMGVLIQNSQGGKYSPKLPSTNPATPGKQPSIDILDAKERPQAFAALYADRSKQLATQAASLAKATALPALMNGLKQVSESQALEIAATGSDTQYQAAVAGIVGHAGDLMSAALKPMSATVDQIVKHASASNIQTVPGQVAGAVLIDTKNGLNSTDKTQLNQIAADATTIAQACEAFGKAGGTKAGALDATKTEATTLAKKATDALDADYNGSMTGSTNPPIVIQNPGTVMRPGAK